MKKPLGFTLAEVLIVVGIIGIVAEMTIPPLVKDIQDTQYKAALKKNFSIFSQAYIKIATDNGGSFENALSSCASDSDYTCFKNVFKPYLNYTKDCDSGTTTGNCFPSQIYHMNGSAANSYFRDNAAGFMLKDGTLVDMALADRDCNYPRGTYTTECGWVSIDVNGFKKPNKWGKDVYTFIIAKDRVRPNGMPGDGWDTCSSTWGYGCATAYLFP